jgi:hypothetical protein
MAKICIVLVAALAVAAVADPLRRKRSDQVIDVHGVAAGWGAGWANDNHQAHVGAVGIPGGSGSGWGDSGWSGGVPAAISVANSGGSDVAGGAEIVQVTTNDGQNLAGLQAVDVYNVAQAADSLDAVATGGDVDLESSSNAAAGGSGTIGADGELSITSDGASSLGMAAP